MDRPYSIPDIISNDQRHLDCPYEKILNGSIESRLTSKNKKLILSFLASELQTAKITASRPVVEEGGTLNLAGKCAYQDLKKLIMVLKMGKPPVDIAPSKLFDQIVKKLENLLDGSKIENLIEKAMIRDALTPMHCDKIDALAKIMHQVIIFSPIALPRKICISGLCIKKKYVDNQIECDITVIYLGWSG